MLRDLRPPAPGRLPLVLLLAGAAAAGQAPGPPAAGRLFRDVTAEAGIGFRHHSAPDKNYILESMSGGVALFDYDNDGFLDIYLLDSPTVATAAAEAAARSALYRNRGNGTFEDVTDKAKLGQTGWAMGVCVADLDGDGWRDLYVTAFGGNHLYRNDRDGTFTDVTEAAGVRGGGWSTGCGFADYDRDGRLDLFVSRYVKIDLGRLPEPGRDKNCHYRGIPVQCGPRGLPGEGDLLFHNDGQGRFSEVAAKAGVSDPKGYFGLGIAWFDANDDGWLDLYVADDSSPSLLYLNQQDGTFKEAAFALGVAVSEDGAEQGGMGVAVGDYDGSGRFSLYKTNFADEYNNLYRNDGPSFTDVAYPSRTAQSSVPYVGWGTAFLDYDNDGALDLIAVNGHVYPQVDKAPGGGGSGYRQRTLVYRNRGDRSFDEVAAQLGPALNEARVSRGLAVGDIDNDGRLDVVVNDLDGSPQLLHNEGGGESHWLIVRLVGKSPNTDAIGAVVKLTAGSRSQRRLVQSGTGYLSQDDLRRHFGLGKESRIDLLEVRWPDGTTSRMEGLKADQILEVRQP
ncbi:MAG TPA: CRTAC1 family protein [Vicinamibacteria bacterium]